MDSDLDRLRKRIDRFVKKQQITLTAFGKRAAGTPNLVDRLDAARIGRGNVTMATLRKVADYLDGEGAS